MTLPMPRIELTSTELETVEGLPLTVRVLSDGDEGGNGLIRIEHRCTSMPNSSRIIDLSPLDYSEAWFQRLCRALEMDAEFRDRDFAIPAVDDAALEAAFSDAQYALAREGMAIKMATLGEEDPFICRHPSIFLAEGFFPIDLQRAWWNAGFRSLPAQVQAKAPVGYSLQAAEALLRSLHDWQTGDLDLEGHRYRLDIKIKDSRPTLPAVSHTRPLHEIQAEIVQLNALGDKAKFKDFLKLKSGRDDLTRKKLDELRVSVQRYYPGIPAPAAFDGDPALEASWSRWILRGLKPRMAERKILTDLEVQNKARPTSPTMTP